MSDRRRKTSAKKKVVHEPTADWTAFLGRLRDIVGIPGAALLLLYFGLATERISIPPGVDSIGHVLSIGLLFLLALILRQGRTLLAAIALGSTLLPDYPGAFLLPLGLPPIIGFIVLLSPRHPLRRRNLFGMVILAILGWLGARYGLDWAQPLLEEWRTALAPWSLEFLGAVVCLSVLLFRLVFRPSPMVRGAFWGFLPLTGILGPEKLPMNPITIAATLWILGALGEAHFLSYRDALTRLPGRRAFDRELAELGRSYVIAMVDVDHFKRVNDRHGHDVGDQVLARIGSRLARLRGGRCFRYGGEEFAVVFRGRKLPWSKDRLDSLRERIAREPFGLRGKKRKLKVTVSIGAAARSPKRSRPEEVLAAADKALYRAKKAGRNRVLVAS